MSTAELLKQIKKLSPKQREKFLSLVLAMEDKPEKKRPPKKGKVKWPDIVARARRVTGGRIMPNAVLLEREEYPF